MVNYKRQKGEKLYTSESNYTVFDMEMTDFIASESQIIEIAALRVRDNVVVDTFCSLIDPQMHISSIVSSITHISNEMVVGAPTLEEISVPFLDFLGDDIVIGHNIDNFDYNIIYDMSMKTKDKPFTNSFIDTYHLAKRRLPERGDNSLSSLAIYLGLDVTVSHRAEADCYVIHKLYQALKDMADKKDKIKNTY